MIFLINIVQNALKKAGQINKSQDLSFIKIWAHDEIFQNRVLVLVGCDVVSIYTSLLKKEEHRDTTTWGYPLLELNDQGMKLDYTIGDDGKGIRSGQREAWPGVPRLGDVSHLLYDMDNLVTLLENRAKSTLEAVENLEKNSRFVYVNPI